MGRLLVGRIEVSDRSGSCFVITLFPLDLVRCFFKDTID
jgi:hypothetical protein